MIMLPDNSKPLVSRYRLRSAKRLNSASNRRELDGVLIRTGDGFGCIQPWPELGDPPLEKCLADLQGARRWPIVRRALRCAEYDAAARANGDSLFEEMEIPASHATLVAPDAREAALAVESGFSMIKLKAGRDLAVEKEFLIAMAADFPSVKWRLDFNESLDPGQAAEFLTGLPPEVVAAVDFVEDPCPFSESTWADLRRATRMKLAIDREAAPHREAAQVMVIKPAVDEPYLLGEAAFSRGQRVVVTSYMDHPVGQAFAAWEAARLELQLPGLVGVCGLQTHHLFEPDEFTEALGPWTPEFHPPGGTGLGFDDFLDALPWTRLY